MFELLKVRVFGRSEFGLYACRIVFNGVESTEVQVFGVQGKLEDGLRKREAG